MMGKAKYINFIKMLTSGGGDLTLPVQTFLLTMIFFPIEHYLLFFK